MSIQITPMTKTSTFLEKTPISPRPKENANIKIKNNPRPLYPSVKWWNMHSN
jgi:hypothetical protein